MVPTTALVVTGILTTAGWLVNHIATESRERRTRRTQASLDFVERQLEELYGPLAFLVHQGQQGYLDLIESLRPAREHFFVEDRELPTQDELERWLFYVDHVFMPVNKRIRELLMTRTYLIESDVFPTSHAVFLKHADSWITSHQRWKTKGTEYSWCSKTDWPNQFSEDVLKAFEILKKRHMALRETSPSLAEKLWAELE